MMMPALIIGIALLSFFVRLLDLPLSLGTVILGHLLIAQPFVILVVHARLATSTGRRSIVRAILGPPRSRHSAPSHCRSFSRRSSGRR